MDDETTREPESQGSREYSVEGFTAVELSTAVEFEITQSPEYSVKAIGNDRLIKRLKAEVHEQTLKVRLSHGLSFISGIGLDDNVKVIITMPQLSKLATSGACKGTAKGFRSSDDLEIDLSGAGRAEIDMEAGRTDIEVSGAGKLSGVLKAQKTEIELSGASHCVLSGKGGNTSLDLSGASRADLSEFDMNDSDIDLSGASRVKIRMDGKLNADLSGASSLEYSGNVVLGNTSTSGASRLKQAS